MQKQTWSLVAGWVGAIALGSVVWSSCSDGRVVREEGDDDGDSASSTATASSAGAGGTGAGGAPGTGGMSGGTGGMSGGTGGMSGTGGAGACPVGACTPNAPVCGQVASCCIALEDNQAKPTFSLRMSQILMTSPAVFASGLVAGIIGDSVEMNLMDCNLDGTGTFSWLMELDTAAGTLRTGGGKPAANPTAGYCFVNEMLGGYSVTPAQVPSNLAQDKFSAKVGDLLLPIYFDAAATSYILLPMKGVNVSGTLSPDKNCVGKYNADTLDPGANCDAQPPGNLAFTNSGDITGFMTLEDTDTIIVGPLNQSLCVLLSQDAATYGDGGSPNKCKRDANGKIIFKGDWCASTDMAATAACYDAMHVQAGFAASGVRTNGNCP
jgi:hypothetical protein